MQIRMKESQWCNLHAEREVRLRRKAEADSALKHGSTLVAAMLAEGKLIDEALEPLKLTYLEKMDYVAKNTVFIKASDGHEAIQIVWVQSQAICIHRLLSREFRNEFQAYWLGVWTEMMRDTSKEQLIEVMTQKVRHREERRKESGVNGELCFASCPSPIEVRYELRS